VFKTMEDYHGVVLMGNGQKGKGGKLFFNLFGVFIDGGVGIGIEKEIEVFHGTVRSDEEVASCAEVKACFASGPSDGKLLSEGMLGIVPVTAWVLLVVVVPSCISASFVSRVLPGGVLSISGVPGDIVEALASAGSRLKDTCLSFGFVLRLVVLDIIGLVSVIVSSSLVVLESLSLDGLLAKLIEDMVSLFLCCFVCCYSVSVVLLMALLDKPSLIFLFLLKKHLLK